jgi:two-component system, OmpR family, phosphate regulon sensor histidine kinase PhoR
VKHYLKIELSQLLGVFLVCATIGYLVGHLQLSLILALLIYIAKHTYYLVHLARTIYQDEQISPPYPPDIWGLVYKELARHRTRSRKRKRTLNRFASRFRKVASSIPDGLIILNKSGQVDWANPAANQLLNVSWPRDEGVPLTTLLPIEELADYLDAPDYHKPLDFPSPINKAIIISVRVTPFGSKKAQRLLVVRNITELYNLNQTRRDFVSNVSHELRTPLTVITGFLENLNDKEVLSFQRRPFVLMLEQAERMNSIINDLLALSRLEMGQAASSEKPVKVPELLQKIVEQAKALADQKGGYDLHLEVDNELCLLGEESELQSAFSNLIFNAVIHTPPKTHIKVSWKREGQEARLCVEDSGPGIEQQHVPRLTERFYRVDKARSRQSGGTGLGLAIVKHIIGRHDGELRIYSQPGVGSQFICAFPEETLLEKSQLQQQAS